MRERLEFLIGYGFTLWTIAISVGLVGRVAGKLMGNEMQGLALGVVAAVLTRIVCIFCDQAPGPEIEPDPMPSASAAVLGSNKLAKI